jgi:predicted helicase
MTTTQKHFNDILLRFRSTAHSERDKGDRFEWLMQRWLQTDPTYAPKFQKVWLWNDFPAKADFGSKDTGIDLVAQTRDGGFWAIQCKFFQEGTYIDKPAVDTFLSTSSRTFVFGNNLAEQFSHRLWIDTTGRNWSDNAEEAIYNQNPPFSRVGLFNLENSPVDWEKIDKDVFGEPARLVKKQPRPHQIQAIADAKEYFKTADRGKLIMACGTGKTYTSLKIAESETQGTGLILFLVPSIALLGQTLREWAAESEHPLRAICICSDPKVSKKESDNKDTGGISTVDLALPASTDPKVLLKQFDDFSRSEQKEGLTVVFSTYQSIEAVAAAQQALLEKQVSKQDPYGIFDLIICDEAHRTTGVTLSGDDESTFVRVHDNAFLKAKKRVYMTATPRLFNDDSKSRAAQAEAILCSMDDPKFYGEEFMRIGFGEAVEKGLLADYKVLVLSISDNDMPAAVQKSLTEGGEIKTDDMLKLVGCVNALSKIFIGDEGNLKDTDPEPMRRAVAFCPSIKDSKQITAQFNKTRETFLPSVDEERRAQLVMTYADHVDGTMSALARDEKLRWLQAVPENSQECRILTNARCLSEGVDVPSLDAVLFLSARNSQVDVVQSVGRVMRRVPGKKYGYIIIPVVTPSDITPEAALADNDRYRVVWTVLNALRAHDDRFNSMVNKIELNNKRDDKITVGATDNFSDREAATGAATDGDSRAQASAQISRQLALQFEGLQSAVFAKLVQKVGDRRYWEQWAKDVAEIAERQIRRITNLVQQEGEHQKAFLAFLQGLRKNINPAISESEAIEMLSQHLITKPVFEALFEGYSFVKSNAISVAMQQMLDILESQNIEKDTETLQKFYESVKSRAAGIDNAEGKQRIIIELYDKFFKTAFPKMVEKLGIVYTPVEVVDFIIHSVEDVLQKEFGRSISDENVHVLDPFTGTGTFITRLLQSGLIQAKDLHRKYANELHANEIVLLAYYIAAVNIENAFHDATPDPDDGFGKPTYFPFEGICLTDTFQLGETDAAGQDVVGSLRLVDENRVMLKNSARVQMQKAAPLRVIMGNPPYSIGQKSANDNAQNQSYPTLDKRISDTYAKGSTAGLSKSLYDAYIKAFRWSTDRLDKTGGVIAFVSNGAWLDGNSTDGFRKCLEKEFSSIYVFDLRGNQRTSGELSRKEGGKIFGSGSRTPIAITLLVKNPTQTAQTSRIFYHDIGDYLSREDKLKIVGNLKSVGAAHFNWQELVPNEHGDWISVRNEGFDHFIPIDADKKFDLGSKSFFVTHAIGVATNRDSWVYNFSREKLSQKVQQMIGFYNEQASSFAKSLQANSDLKADNFIEKDETKISWTRALKGDLAKKTHHAFKTDGARIGNYRPFQKFQLYFQKEFIESPGLSPKFFPIGDSENSVICVTGAGASKPFSAIVVDVIPNMDNLEKTQCFPLYYYEERQKTTPGLFDTSDSELIRHDGVSDWIHNEAQKRYGAQVTKEDVFYYVYGFLHHPAYRTTFAADLKKMLPRLPLVDKMEDFWAFSRAGRKLAELHLNYETIEKPAEVIVTYTPALTVNYRVEKMRFPSKTDKSRIFYNPQITIDNIPPEAFAYVVNGKSAIEWVMERYAITMHKDSGITNDPNDWATESGNPKYILDVLLGVIKVSLETVKIVDGLPELASFE